MAADSPARQLARFAGTFVGVPAEVRREAVRALVNHVACAVAGRAAREVAALHKVLTAEYGAGPGIVIGHGGPGLPLPESAFLNAIACNIQDFDDTHQRTVIHPTAPVAPALFAVAQKRVRSGLEVLDALAIGVEVACRIGNAMSPEHYRRGWHITATCGVFGAAAGAARLLSVGFEDVHHALGIAAGQAAGLVENLAHGAKNVGIGNAARGGYMSAVMAAAGIDGPPDALEGRFGYMNVVGPLIDRDALTDGLGETWELLANDYKPWPVGVVLNPVIDACLELAGRLGPAESAAVESVLVEGHPLLAERTDRPRLPGANETRLSCQHVAAVCFLRGNPSLPDFTIAARDDPAIAAFRERVRVAATEAIPVGAARVMVALPGGRTETAAVQQARGSQARPLSDEELDAKFRTLTADNAAGIDGEALLAALRGMESSTDVSQVLRLSGGGRPQ